MATPQTAVPSRFYDAIVVGAGIQGTFAAYHLAKRGQKTLLLEQFPLPHTRGSSHGQTRIIRSAYPQDYYVAMMVEAYRLWAELEEEAGTKLRREVPMLLLGHKDNPVFQMYCHAMQRNHIPSEALTAETFAQRFPGIHLCGGEEAVCDHSAGILFADKAVKAGQDQFRRNGGTICDGEKVLGILPGAVITVTTSQGEYRAKHLVVTAGAWASRLLAPLGLQLPLQPLRINVCYWRAKAGSPPGLLEKLPCFLGINLNGEKRDIYGLPAGEYPGLVKVCYHYGSPVDPDQPDQPGSSPAPDLHILQDFVSKYLPGLEPAPAVQERCLYTITPDENFVLDRHPHFRNIAIGAGFSGHGFKFGPVVGKILCELSLGEEPSYDLAPFQISRFSSSLKAPL